MGLILTTSPTNMGSIKNGETLANIFGRIYGIVKKDYLERKKYLEIEHSFKKVSELKDEERHQRLLEAIANMRGGNTATKVKKTNSSGFGLGAIIGAGFAALAAAASARS